MAKLSMAKLHASLCLQVMIKGQHQYTKSGHASLGNAWTEQYLAVQVMTNRQHQYMQY